VRVFLKLSISSDVGSSNLEKGSPLSKSTNTCYTAL
jgi:hypothetical protein